MRADVKTNQQGVVVIWPVVMVSILGIFCGTRIPLLPFSLAIMVAALGGTASMWIDGVEPGFILLELGVIMFALQAGYLVGLISRDYLLQRRSGEWYSSSETVPQEYRNRNVERRMLRVSQAPLP
ncbi:hypothetical protein LMIY3S_01411 [Labrys miyagiensis]